MSVNLVPTRRETRISFVSLFNSLPREVRDQIYNEAFLNPLDSLLIDYYYGFTVQDNTARDVLTMLHKWAPKSQIALEVCENMYHDFTFRVNLSSLPDFFGDKTSAVDSSWIGNEGGSNFDNKPFLRSVVVTMNLGQSENREKSVHELLSFLQCPYLERISIVSEYPGDPVWFSAGEPIVYELANAWSMLRQKFGECLRTYIHNEWRDRDIEELRNHGIKWLWGHPSEKAMTQYRWVKG
ncbi:hypothetical protein MMC28_011198 [Mycoblastus sanguinarius]|nr:hypothetical protein [Mycoblastus sanguinarius]